MKHILFAILMMLTVQFCSGCVTVSSLLDNHSLSAEYDDAGIKTKITAALLRKNATKANDIEVQCFNGNVYLIGEANAEFKEYALATAEEIAGAGRVTTHWFPANTAVTDTDQALKLTLSERFNHMDTDPNTRIAVDVWGGNVVLTGIVAKEDMLKNMIEITEDNKDVKQITSYLQGYDETKKKP